MFIFGEYGTALVTDPMGGPIVYHLSWVEQRSQFTDGMSNNEEVAEESKQQVGYPLNIAAMERITTFSIDAA